MYRIKTKIKGSSLLETLIAIVLMVVSFSVATMIIINVLASDRGRLKMHAMLELENMYISTIKEKTYINSTVESGKMKLIKSIEPYKGSAILYKITLLAVQENGQTLAEIEKLVVIQKP